MIDHLEFEPKDKTAERMMLEPDRRPLPATFIKVMIASGSLVPPADEQDNDRFDRVAVIGWTLVAAVTLAFWFGAILLFK